MAAFDLDNLDDVEPREPLDGAVHPRLRPFSPPRRDPIALGFGAAFILFGLLGLLRSAGVPVPEAWLYPAILIGLGAVGLVSLTLRGRRA